MKLLRGIRAPENRDAFLAVSGDFHDSLAVHQALNADLARYDLGPELPALFIQGIEDFLR